jgi:hypothetical protein
LYIQCELRQSFAWPKRIIFRQPLISALAAAAIFVAIFPKITLLLIWVVLFSAGVNIVFPLLFVHVVLFNNVAFPFVAWTGVYVVAIRRGWRLGQIETHFKVLALAALVVAPALYLLRTRFLDAIGFFVKLGSYHVASVVLLPMFAIWAGAGWVAWQFVGKALHRTGRSLTLENERVGLFFAVLLAIVLPTTLVPAIVNTGIQKSLDDIVSSDQDHEPFAALPSTVALRFSGSLPQGRLVCDSLCLRLLYNRAVERVIVANDNVWRRRPDVIVYRIEKRDVCPSPRIGKSEVVWGSDGGDRGTVLQRVRRKIGEGECLIAEKGDLDAAALTVEISENSFGTSRADRWRLTQEPEILQRVTVRSGGEILFQRTEAAVLALSMPWGFDRRDWFRHKVIRGEIDMFGRDVMPALFGRAVRPIEGPPVGP